MRMRITTPCRVLGDSVLIPSSKKCDLVHFTPVCTFGAEGWLCFGLVICSPERTFLGVALTAITCGLTKYSNSSNHSFNHVSFISGAPLAHTAVASNIGTLTQAQVSPRVTCRNGGHAFRRAIAGPSLWRDNHLHPLRQQQGQRPESRHGEAYCNFW